LPDPFKPLFFIDHLFRECLASHDGVVQDPAPASGSKTVLSSQADLFSFDLDSRNKLLKIRIKALWLLGFLK
jgi:hypothetical protein